MECTSFYVLTCVVDQLLINYYFFCLQVSGRVATSFSIWRGRLPSFYGVLLEGLVSRVVCVCEGGRGVLCVFNKSIELWDCTDCSG